MDTTPEVRTNPTLWRRLRNWRNRSDGEHFVSTLDASLRLREGGAERLTDEYIRFLYLCLTTPARLAPSRIVDAAWRFHLIDARGYFDQFCPETLGRTLRHAPLRPGLWGDPAYTLALRRYVEEFGTAPPPDVWPGAVGCLRLWVGSFAPYALVAFVLGYPAAFHFAGREIPLLPYLPVVAGFLLIRHLAGDLLLRKGERRRWGTEAGDDDGDDGD